MKQVKDTSELIREIKQNKSFYICGNGITGKRCNKWLALNGIQSKGFIDEKKEHCFRYSDIGELVDKDSIFLVVSRNYRNAMVDELRKRSVDEDNILDLTSIEVQEELVYKLADEIKCNNCHLRMEKFYNKYKGKRCFLVGNGPSLSVEDLKKLSDDITFATNEIYSVFESSGFKPTFYLIEDITFAEKNFNTRSSFEWLLEKTANVFCSKKNVKYAEYAESDYDNLFFYKLVEGRNGFSRDISEEIYGFGTTVFSMYQMAFYMGFREIYLIGMDCSFHKVIDDMGTISINDGVLTHPQYMKETEEDPALYNESRILIAHERARLMAEKCGIKIYNATRGGKLEIFERVDFDSLFGEE